MRAVDGVTSPSFELNSAGRVEQELSPAVGSRCASPPRGGTRRLPRRVWSAVDAILLKPKGTRQMPFVTHMHSPGTIAGGHSTGEPTVFTAPHGVPHLKRFFFGTDAGPTQATDAGSIGSPRRGTRTNGDVY
eukprot:gene8533-biopygen10656